MDSFLSNGFVQLVGVLLTALSAYAVAKFTRSGAKEINQTTGWTNLVTALQAEVASLRKEEDDTQSQIKELDNSNKELARRVYALERSRYRWKWWGRRVVEVMEGHGITFPNPPEPLEDTDPSIQV